MSGYCPNCDGSGIEGRWTTGNRGGYYDVMPCMTCDGTGTTPYSASELTSVTYTSVARSGGRTVFMRHRKVEPLWINPPHPPEWAGELIDAWRETCT